MLRSSISIKKFLDFSGSINDETRQKLFAITDAHPAMKNHPAMQRLAQDQKAFISISAITSINEAILAHSITLAQQASTSDEKACLKALMEQNVLTVASVALNTIMTEHVQDNLRKISTITDATSKQEI